MLAARRGADRAKSAKFDPKAYEDRYEAALLAMIKEKLKGHKPIIAAEPQRGNVVNLMDALKASRGQAKPAAPSKSKPPDEARQKRSPRRRSRGEGEPRPRGPRQGRAPRAGLGVGYLAADVRDCRGASPCPRRLAAREVERAASSAAA